MTCADAIDKLMCQNCQMRSSGCTPEQIVQCVRFFLYFTTNKKEEGQNVKHKQRLLRS